MPQPAEPHGPIEEWTDQDLIDQLRFVRAELADRKQEVAGDGETSPEHVIVEELDRRGIPIPPGADDWQPGKRHEEPHTRRED